MIGTLSDNTNSLSLAIDARTVIEALSESQAHGRLEEPALRVLSDAIASLNALGSGAPLFEHLSAASSFDSYGQIRTLEEAKIATADERLLERLQFLLDGSVGEEMQQNVKSAIQFFTAIENRALQRFNQSLQTGF